MRFVQRNIFIFTVLAWVCPFKVQANAKLGPPLGTVDFNNALQISVKYPPASTRQDPMMMSNRFEGDILGIKPRAMSQSTMKKFRNAIRAREMLWPKGQVPYVISSQFSSDERAVIARAIMNYHQSTCLRFVPRNNENDYIHIQKGRGCSSYVGRIGGSQSVTLGNGCFRIGTVMHELMHAVGFFHEQSRADRDKFIRININNVVPEAKFNFVKHDLNSIQHLDAPYDTGSVMHYGAWAFSVNGRPTIYLRNRNRIILSNSLGQRQGFSRIDIMKLNKLYKCNL